MSRSPDPFSAPSELPVINYVLPLGHLQCRKRKRRKRRRREEKWPPIHKLLKCTTFRRHSSEFLAFHPPTTSFQCQKGANSPAPLHFALAKVGTGIPRTFLGQVRKLKFTTFYVKLIYASLSFLVPSSSSSSVFAWLILIHLLHSPQ